MEICTNFLYILKVDTLFVWMALDKWGFCRVENWKPFKSINKHCSSIKSDACQSGFVICDWAELIRHFGMQKAKKKVGIWRMISFGMEEERASSVHLLGLSNVEWWCFQDSLTHEEEGLCKELLKEVSSLNWWSLHKRTGAFEAVALKIHKSKEHEAKGLIEWSRAPMMCVHYKALITMWKMSLGTIEHTYINVKSFHFLGGLMPKWTSWVVSENHKRTQKEHPKALSKIQQKESNRKRNWFLSSRRRRAEQGGSMFIFPMLFNKELKELQSQCFSSFQRAYIPKLRTLRWGNFFG